MDKIIVIPALYTANFQEVEKMDKMGVEISPIMEIRDTYVYKIDSTQDFHNPRVYNDGALIINSIIFTNTTEYSTPLTQKQIFDLYVSDRHHWKDLF